ncbi:quinone oxidoreductase family protein [Pseudonocardia spinosispora]|uniref:quinone oxidoreductase family protein n=1 Tax=Pseudonocardia spinosispora TaxID=103441 RepID=UPI00041BE65F|nr:zinc-binding dehydrogenase [Pseudonocardia spinosispora]
MRTIRFHRYGGPEVLQLDDVPTPEPGPGQVLVRVNAAGVTLPVVRLTRGGADGGGVPLPHAPGGDVAGTIAALGPDVDGWRIGQRVAGLAFSGAYAEFAPVAATMAASVPDGVDDHAAVLLVRAGQVALGALEAARVEPGDSVLVTAGAGAVGQLALQLAAVRGAGHVVAAVGSPEKAEQLRAFPHIGKTEVTTYDRLSELASVDVVLDGVGGAVQAGALDVLAPFGRLVTFNADGTPVSANELRIHSRSVIGFNMAHFAGRRPESYQRNRQVLWELTLSGALQPVVGTVLPLDEAARAHRLIEDRRNLGKIVLVP